EADEPAATQPRMYATIRKLDTVRKQYADRLIAEGLADKKAIDEANEAYRDKLEAGEPVVDLLDEDEAIETVDWEPYLDGEWREEVDTGVEPATIRKLSDQLTTLPEGFELHKQVQRIIDSRKKMATGESPMDWGFAETMAYATLINDDCGLRLVGQDSGRGTFFHRHAVLHNQVDGSSILPLRQFTDDPRRVTVIDSLLSEEAVLGFEYGYATAEPTTLTIWEAQFGDFANGAQVVIDQFIASGEAKWGRLCGL